jgi:hypothetical protein
MCRPVVVRAPVLSRAPNTYQVQHRHIKHNLSHNHVWSEPNLIRLLVAALQQRLLKSRGMLPR